MVLSKRFLCGAESSGSYEKGEALDFTRTERATRRSFPSAEFTMGHYTDVGIGRSEDI